jgi:hypothetical protein
MTEKTRDILPVYSGNILMTEGIISIDIFDILGEKTTPPNLTVLSPLLSKDGIIKIEVSFLW